MLPDNTYLISTEYGDLIYAPLSRFVCKFSENEKKISIPPQVISVDNSNDNYSFQWGHVIVIPTQVCNLACTYCYARFAHSREIIKKETLQIVYDFVLSSKEEKNKSVSFIGGGEPLAAWEIIKWSIEYIEEHKQPFDTVDVYLTTNGTLLNNDRIDFLKHHNVHLEISFDIIKDIQDQQRPYRNNKQSSYDSVIENLKKLEEIAFPYNIRTTITPQSVGQMPEMVKQLSSFNMIKRIQLEPVTQEKSHALAYYQDYIKFFWLARDFGYTKNIKVTNSIISSVNTVRKQFCTGEFCVNPNGDIVACHRNSSPKDILFSACLLGNATQSIDIQAHKLNGFRRNNSLPARCRNCFARWHCAGYCPLEWANNSQEEIHNKCWFIKENVKRVLLEKLSSNVSIIE